MNKKLIWMLAATISFTMTIGDAQACTNILVGRDASKDGSVFLSYCVDGYGYYDRLHYSPAATHESGEMIDVYDIDTYEYHGQIPQVAQTWNVVGYTNEWQVTLGETTCGGRKEMVDDTGLLDYGSLMYLTLERAKTAREAIRVMTSLVEQYGYCSDGEIFSIADADEAWLLFMNGCGIDRLRSPERTVWAAVRIPDNAIAAHANFCRLTKFLDGRYIRVSLDDLLTKYPASDDDLPVLMVCSDNVVNFARKMDWYEGEDADFSYNEAYAPKGPEDIRYGEGRVWSIFNRFTDDMSSYVQYASGRGGEPMPLWVVPNNKVGLAELRAAMRDHFEDTPFTNSGTIAGGWFEMPYSIPPYALDIDGESYIMERTVSTCQSAWSFIAQMRSWMPRETGCLWFGNDDGNMVAFTPLYNCLTRVPYCFTDAGANETTFSIDNAYWVCNWVSNMVYPRYSLMFPSLQAVRDSIDQSYDRLQPEIERQALALSGEERVKCLTDYSCLKGDEMIDRWRRLAFHLIVKYNDFVVRGTNPDGSFIADANGRTEDLQAPGMSQNFYRTLFATTGDRFVAPIQDEAPIQSVAPVRQQRRRMVSGIYSVSGVRRSKPEIGLNIIDGRKIIKTDNDKTGM